MQIHFHAIRKHNERPVKYGPVGKKELAVFSCHQDELTKLSGELKPVRHEVSCIILGHPMMRTVKGEMVAVNRAIRACDFDFYEVK